SARNTRTAACSSPASASSSATSRARIGASRTGCPRASACACPWATGASRSTTPTPLWETPWATTRCSPSRSDSEEAPHAIAFRDHPPGRAHRGAARGAGGAGPVRGEYAAGLAAVRRGRGAGKRPGRGPRGAVLRAARHCRGRLSLDRPADDARRVLPARRPRVRGQHVLLPARSDGDADRVRTRGAAPAAVGPAPGAVRHGGRGTDALLHGPRAELRHSE